MDTSQLNPHVQKLLEETGTTIKDKNDLIALSQVSVRDLARLFDELAKNLQQKKPQRREVVFSNWKNVVVQKYREEIDYSHSLPQSSSYESQCDGPSRIILSSGALEQAQYNRTQHQHTEIITCQKDTDNVMDRLRTLRETDLDTERSRAHYKALFLEKLMLQFKDSILVSSTPQLISNGDTSELRVEVLKHTCNNGVILQFIIENIDTEKVNFHLLGSIQGLDIPDAKEFVHIDLGELLSIFVRLYRTDAQLVPVGKLYPVIKINDKSSCIHLIPIELTVMDFCVFHPETTTIMESSSTVHINDCE